MLLLIPLGGQGTRFQTTHSVPKCLVPCHFQPILFWLLDCIRKYCADATIIMPYHFTLKDWRLEEKIRREFPMLNVMFMAIQPTSGASETVWKGLEHLTLPDQPLMCLDSDSFYRRDIFNIWQDQHNSKNLLFWFEDTGTLPQFSYLDIEPCTHHLIDIREKTRISNKANVGVYCFASWHQARDACATVVSTKTDTKEIYLSTVISLMLRSGETIHTHHLSTNDFVCLGTPEQLAIFLHSEPDANSRKYRFCFDLDGTLVTEERDYINVKPITHNINLLRWLFDQGHTIVIYTARRMKTHQGNVGRVIEDVGELTLATLKRLDIPYHEFHFGKPYADAYIDDKAISAHGDVEKSLGFAVPTSHARSYHNVTLHRDHVLKSGSNLSGEIWAYQNLPINLKHLTPKLLDVALDGSWMKLERIFGVPAARLYLGQMLEKSTFLKILESLEFWHGQIIDKQDNVNIHANWHTKLQHRWENHGALYERISSEAVFIYEYISAQLCTFNFGVSSVVHGDPVLSNVLIRDGRPIWIDMRGKQGEQLSLLGDVFYDWAKIWQSLVGYDAILHDTYIPNTYEIQVQNWFRDWFCERWPDVWPWLNILAASLLFSLIPLHEDEPLDKLAKYILLAKKLIKK